MMNKKYCYLLNANQIVYQFFEVGMQPYRDHICSSTHVYKKSSMYWPFICLLYIFVYVGIG